MEKPRDAMPAPGLDENALRGSVEMVTGMPSRVCSASFCSRLFQSAPTRGEL